MSPHPQPAPITTLPEPVEGILQISSGKPAPFYCAPDPMPPEVREVLEKKAREYGLFFSAGYGLLDRSLEMTPLEQENPRFLPSSIARAVCLNVQALASGDPASSRTLAMSLAGAAPAGALPEFARPAREPNVLRDAWQAAYLVRRLRCRGVVVVDLQRSILLPDEVVILVIAALGIIHRESEDRVSVFLSGEQPVKLVELFPDFTVTRFRWPASPPPAPTAAP